MGDAVISTHTGKMMPEGMQLVLPGFFETALFTQVFQAFQELSGLDCLEDPALVIPDHPQMFSDLWMDRDKAIIVVLGGAVGAAASDVNHITSEVCPAELLYLSDSQAGISH